MKSGQTMDAGNNETRRGNKRRVSPELQEFIHMLSALEHQFDRDSNEH